MAHSPTSERAPHIDFSLMAALIGNFLIRLDGGMAGQLMAWFLKDAHQSGVLLTTATVYGVLQSIFYIVELGFSPIMGAKSDRHGNRALLLISPFMGMAAVLIAGVAAFGASHGLSGVAIAGVSMVLILLGVMRLLQGFAAAASIPAILSYLSARTEGSLTLRGRVMSIFEVTTAVGLLVGPIIGVQLWKFTGAWGFIITGLAFLASAAFFWKMRDDRTEPAVATEKAAAHDDFWTSLQRVLRRRDLMTFIPAWLCINGVVGLWATHLVYQMINGSLNDSQFLTNHFNENVMSICLGAFGAVFCIGVIVWGFLLGRLREVTIMRLSLIGLAVVLLAIYGINLTGEIPWLLWSLIGVALIGLLLQAGFAPSAVTYLARLASVSAQDRGLVMGVYSVVLGLGQFVGILLGGPFADNGGVNGILLLTLLLALIGGFSIARLAPPDDEVATSPEHAKLSLHA